MKVKVEISNDYETVSRVYEFTAFTVTRMECSDKLNGMVLDALNQAFPGNVLVESQETKEVKKRMRKQKSK